MTLVALEKNPGDKQIELLGTGLTAHLPKAGNYKHGNTAKKNQQGISLSLGPLRYHLQHPVTQGQRRNSRRADLKGEAKSTALTDEHLTSQYCGTDSEEEPQNKQVVSNTKPFFTKFSRVGGYVQEDI